MQYFVALEDTRELRWQMELLYESFRLLDLQDSLVVAICYGSSTSRTHPYPKSIEFENMGRKIGFPYFNKCYGMVKALEKGVLKQPFVVLDTDMFLIREIPRSQSAIAAQAYNVTWDHVSHLLKEFAVGDEWCDIGGIYQFNNAPTKVFEDIVKYTYDICKKYKDSAVHTCGFNLGIGKSNVTIERCRDYEMPLQYNGNREIDWNSYIVHYRQGYSPYFVKKDVYNSIDFSFDLPLPMRILLNTPAKGQPNVVIMQTLIQSWLDSNLNRIQDLL